MLQNIDIKKSVKSKIVPLRPILIKTYHKCFTKYGDFDISPLKEEAINIERHIFNRKLSDKERKILFNELALLMWKFTKSWIDSEVLPDDPVIFEHWCAQQIKLQGWDVINTRASGDQGVDVIASRDTMTVSVQCKRYSKPVGNKAVQEVVSGRVYYSTVSACVISTAGFTNSALELARVSHVELLDAQDISRFSRLFGFENKSRSIDFGPSELEKFLIPNVMNEMIELRFSSPADIAICQLMKFSLDISPSDDPLNYGDRYQSLQAEVRNFQPKLVVKLENISSAIDSLDEVFLELSRYELLVAPSLCGFLCLNCSIEIPSDQEHPNHSHFATSRNTKVQEVLRTGRSKDLPIFQIFDHATGEEIQHSYKNILKNAMVEASLVARSC
ncbi:restriction endonuclease [Primorskyibacter sp. 2E233]|uniref:restriction endonuclease n=1 Tax=Primorskyibacter sp. 2E233 TaxID=3413431 RepID=UPI003BF2F8DE